MAHVVMVKRPTGDFILHPFVGMDTSQMYFKLMNWWLDTDETTPEGMPWMIYEVDMYYKALSEYTLMPNRAPLYVKDWMNGVFDKVREALHR